MSFLNSLPLSSQAATASQIAGTALLGAFLPGAGGETFNPFAAAGAANPANAPALPSLASSIEALFGPNWMARIVTGFLGLLLIAAAIFTHPTVINVGKKVGKAAAEAGAAAA